MVASDINMCILYNLKLGHLHDGLALVLDVSVHLVLEYDFLEFETILIKFSSKS